MNLKIHFETLGCRLNQIESESAARFFSDAGFFVQMESVNAQNAEDRNVIICVVNTCTVTTKAEQKARRVIRLLLKKFPLATVIVTGCYAQVEPAEIEKIDNRIAVLKGMNKARLSEVPEVLKNFLGGNKVFDESKYSPVDFTKLLRNSVFVQPERVQAENPFKLSTDTFLSHSRSSLKIQDGCNCQCTYCRIHIARGKSVSLAADEVIKRVNDLKNAGQKEVVITTVNIGQYRSEYEGKKIDFTDLLEILLEKTSGISFRLSSLYPEIVDERFAQIIKDERVCPHFHISLQSGSDRILHLMKRPYKVDQVYTAIELLKKAKKNPFIACDIIAGFPGETEEDFAETLKLVDWAKFSWIHAFPFSARPGTEAYSMKPKIPESVAGKRVNQLLEIACKNKIEYINELCGHTIRAIAEKSIDFEGKKCFRSVTENFLHCVVELSEGQIIPDSGSRICLKIVKPLEKSIKKGSEEEAFATLLSVY